MAKDNPSWGYTRIVGALNNVGHSVARTTVAKILKAAGIAPAPERPTVDGCLEPRDSGGLPRFWFFLKQRSSWVWFLAMAAKALAAGPRGRWPRPGCRLQSAATIRPVQTEARRTA
ncbi:MAG: hypothetical protein ACK501_16245 [Planctomycetota bacterium]